MSSDQYLLTIFFKHNQAMNLDEIQKHLRESGFWKDFPPEGMEIVSWYVMMGIGHVVTIKVPSDRLREVNMVIERRAWKAFTTEFYTTYDFKPFYRQFHSESS